MIPKEYNKYIEQLKLFGFKEIKTNKYSYKKYTVDILGISEGNKKGHQLVAYLKKKRFGREDKHIEYGEIQNILIVIDGIKKGLYLTI